MSSEVTPGLRRLYVFGAGGAGREAAWLARTVLGDGVEICFLVDNARYLDSGKRSVRVQLVEELPPDAGGFFVAAVGNIPLRRHAVALCETAGLKAVSLVHPRCEHSAQVFVDEGALVCSGTVLTTDISVGRHAHINIGCTLSHDVVIGDFTTLSPGVHVSGHVRIGKDVFVGTGAVFINGHPDSPLEIGDGAVIAAGACVTRAVAPHTTVVGVPAKVPVR